MSGSKPVYYWDTCLFLAWLKNETTRKAGEMDAIADMLDRFKKRQVSLITSVITTTEISIAKIPAGVDGLLEDVMQRPNFTRLSVDIRVAKLARDLRNWYLAREPEYGGKTLSVPDSLHVATAILYRVNEFHTFDGKDSPKQNALGLLPLSGDVGGYPLIITKPPIPNQSSLPGFAGHGG
jgi:predicted nucleic acid-binding protein